MPPTHQSKTLPPFPPLCWTTFLPSSTPGLPVHGRKFRCGFQKSGERNLVVNAETFKMNKLHNEYLTLTHSCAWPWPVSGISPLMIPRHHLLALRPPDLSLGTSDGSQHSPPDTCPLATVMALRPHLSLCATGAYQTASVPFE